MIFGKTLARVVANDDPEMRGRVRVEAPELFYDPTTKETLPSPWCEGRGGFGLDAGTLEVPPVGSLVYVQARASLEADIYDLIYEPGPHAETATGSAAPKTGRGEDDETVVLRASSPIVVPSAANRLVRTRFDGTALVPGVKETTTIPGLPPSANAGRYPHVTVRKTLGGFVFESDDTPGRERFHLWHPQGSCVEIGATGGWVQRQTAYWSETQGTETLVVGASSRKQVVRDLQLGVGGNHVDEARGRRVISAGEVNIEARLSMLIDVRGPLQQSIAGRASYDFMADVRFRSGGEVDISGALGATLSSPLNAAIFGGMQATLASGLIVKVAAPEVAISGEVNVNIAAPEVTVTAAANVAVVAPTVTVETATMNVGVGAGFLPVATAPGVLALLTALAATPQAGWGPLIASAMQPGSPTYIGARSLYTL